MNAGSRRGQTQRRVYTNAQAVSATTRTIIEQHLKGPHAARELAKALYEGYDFKQDPLDVAGKLETLPKYLRLEFDKALAAKLKAPALRAAYLQAIREQEKGMAALERVLKTAFYERNRYYANRIARTELHRAYTDRQSRELMIQERIEYVQLRLSSKHPKTDICDYHARLNAYGLGPGVYPKADAPKPPFHPHCYCLLSPKIDLNPKLKPRFNPNAGQAFLASLPSNEARQVAGSIDKRDRILAGKATIKEVYNEGKDALYQWKRVGDVAQTAAMPKVHPDVLRSGDAPAIQAAEALIKALTVPDWPLLNLAVNDRMTRATLDALTTSAHIQEVADFLQKVRSNPATVSSLEWHYFKRRYQDQWPIDSVADLQSLVLKVLSQPQAAIHKPGERYHVLSKDQRYLVVVDKQGTLITVMEPTAKKIQALGGAKWHGQELIN